MADAQQPDLALHGTAQGPQLLEELALGLVLGDQEREAVPSRKVGEPGAQQHLVAIAEGEAGRLEAACHERLGQPQLPERVERPRVEDGGARGALRFGQRIHDQEIDAGARATWR